MAGTTKKPESHPASLTHVKLRTKSNRIDAMKIPDAIGLAFGGKGSLRCEEALAGPAILILGPAGSLREAGGRD
jgi:hypothetical protein